MTTIVGIEAKRDNSIILASDLSGTRTNWTQQGDSAYRRQTKGEYQKLHVDNQRLMALGSSGIMDRAYLSFLYSALRGDIDIKGATERGMMPELRDVHLGKWDGKTPGEYMTTFLMATRYGDPRLYTGWPLGKIERFREFGAIGSGSQYATEHLGEHFQEIVRGVNLIEGIDLAVASLEEASRDIYTTGLDIVVITKTGIHEFGEGIKDSVESAKRKSVGKIKSSLRKSQKTK